MPEQKATEQQEALTNLARFVEERAVTRAHTSALNEFLSGVVHEFHHTLRAYDETVSTPPEGDNVDDLAQWLYSAFTEAGKYTLDVSKLRNRLAVGAFLRASTAEVPLGTKMRFRDMVQVSLGIAPATRDHVSAFANRYPACAEQVAMGNGRLSIYRSLARVVGEFGRVLQGELLDQFVTEFDSEIARMLAHNGNNPTLSSMRARGQEIADEKADIGASADAKVKRAIQEYNDERRAASLLRSAASGKAVSLNDVKRAEQRESVESIIRDRMRGLGVDVSRTSIADPTRTVTELHVGWAGYGPDMTDDDLIALESALRSLHTLVGGEIKRRTGKRQHTPAADQWPTSIVEDKRLLQALEASGVAPQDVPTTSDSDLLAVKGIGKTMLEKVREAYSA